MKFTAVDGREIDIAKMKGKVVLVEFWATWCGPCLISLPEVIDVHKRYHAKGFEVVGINLDYRRQELDQFAKARGITWPNFFDGRGWNSPIVARYGVAGIPASFLVDKQGRLRALEVRGNLEAEVKRLLAE